MLELGCDFKRRLNLLFGVGFVGSKVSAFRPKLDTSEFVGNRPPVGLLYQGLRSATKWVVVALALGGVLWLPLHLLTVAHCDDGPAHQRTHAQAEAAHHGHSHDGGDADHHEGEADHHHFTGDHGAQFLAKRQVFLATPLLVPVSPLELSALVVVVRAVVPEADAAPPPFDFSPPASPRAPPLG